MTMQKRHNEGSHQGSAEAMRTGPMFSYLKTVVTNEFANKMVIEYAWRIREIQEYSWDFSLSPWKVITVFNLEGRQT